MLVSGYLVHVPAFRDECNLVAELRATLASLETEKGRSKDLAEQVALLQNEKESLRQTQQQTISLLVSEKSSLSDELSRLDGIEASMSLFESDGTVN